MTATLYAPTAPDFHAERYRMYQKLRDHEPVHLTDDQYLLTRFTDVWDAVHDWEHSLRRLLLRPGHMCQP